MLSVPGVPPSLSPPGDHRVMNAMSPPLQSLPYFYFTKQFDAFAFYSSSCFFYTSYSISHAAITFPTV